MMAGNYFSRLQDAQIWYNFVLFGLFANVLSFVCSAHQSLMSMQNILLSVLFMDYA